MAGIDKTYVSTYQDWKEITDYMKNAEFVCPNGIILRGENYLYYSDATKEEIEEWLSERNGIPVMNTPCAMDYFLIKYCPIELVQERMKEVYDEEDYEAIKNGTSEYDKFVRPVGGKHVKIIKKPEWNYTYKWFNEYLGKYRRTGYSVTLTYPEHIEDAFTEYNEEFDVFLLPGELGSITVAGQVRTDCMSIKAILRKIIKWNLPIGTIVHVFGMHTGESFNVIVKK